MRFVTEGAQPEDAGNDRTSTLGGKYRAAMQKASALLPGAMLECPSCHADLIELKALRQSARRLPRMPFWHRDTRRLMARCTSCNHFHMVFAYPLFNWIPPTRLTTEMTLMTMLVGVLILCAALPSHSLFALMPL